MKKNWLLSSILILACITTIIFTMLQPTESSADKIKAQYLEAEPLTLEEIESDGTNMWSIWKRDLSPKASELPISSNKELQLILVDEKKERMFPIRISGDQLTILGTEFAAFFEADATFYEESEILELKKGDDTLVFRGNTSIVYENGVKTPSSAKALRQGNDLNVPLNVIANGFGYKLRWDDKQQAILIIKDDTDNG